MNQAKNLLNLNNLLATGIAYQCEMCRDTGYVFIGNYSRRCKCQEAEYNLKRKQRMGFTPKMLKMTFSSFDTGFYDNKANIDKAVKACKGFCNSTIQGNNPRGIFLLGSVGGGKTHLISAMANSLVESGVEVHFECVPDMFEKLKATFERNSPVTQSELLDSIKTSDVLFLDDLGVYADTEWACSVLFSIVNHRIQHELPLVVTTNCTMQELENKLGSRITSRLMELCDFYKVVAKTDIRKEVRKI